MPSPSDEGDAPTVPEELLPVKRGPGRPLGAKNKDRVSSIERINREGDPLGFRLKALKRGYVMAAPSEGAKVREKIYLTADEMLRLAGALEDKILARLRSIEVTGDALGTHNNVLIGTLNSLGENQVNALVAALQPQYPHAIEHEPAEPAAPAVVPITPRWSTK
jgi:hypothetical protein